MIQYDEEAQILFDLMAQIAQGQHDGHMTIFRFTGGWKVMFGTPCLTGAGRDEVATLQESPDLATVLRERIIFG